MLKKLKYVLTCHILFLQNQKKGNDQVIIAAPPPSPLMHEHDQVIIYHPPPLLPLVIKSDYLENSLPSPLD